MRLSRMGIVVVLPAPLEPCSTTTASDTGASSLRSTSASTTSVVAVTTSSSSSCCCFPPPGPLGPGPRSSADPSGRERHHPLCARVRRARDPTTRATGRGPHAGTPDSPSRPQQHNGRGTSPSRPASRTSKPCRRGNPTSLGSYESDEIAACRHRRARVSQVLPMCFHCAPGNGSAYGSSMRQVAATGRNRPGRPLSSDA